MKPSKLPGKVRAFWISQDAFNVLAKYAKRNKVSASRAVCELILENKKSAAA